VLGTSLLWRSTVAFTSLKVKSAKCLYLLPVVLVLVIRIWSCLHHWYAVKTYTIGLVSVPVSKTFVACLNLT